MPEEKERPRPHGDPMRDEVTGRRDNREENQAQSQSDAPTDLVGEESDRDKGRGSDANGVPAFDEADGQQRKRQYRDGAELVSGID